jgi:hypothetical protein
MYALQKIRDAEDLAKLAFEFAKNCQKASPMPKLNAKLPKTFLLKINL